MSIRIDWNNALGQQAAEIKQLQAQLAEAAEHRGALAAALAGMSKAHAAGAIDEFIALDRFTGVHREMAEEINALVASHIAVKMQIVDVVTRYEEGDFSVDMAGYRGKRRRSPRRSTARRRRSRPSPTIRPRQRNSWPHSR
jgi:methyl-accepting chemotaxis protein